MKRRLKAIAAIMAAAMAMISAGCSGTDGDSGADAGQDTGSGNAAGGATEAGTDATAATEDTLDYSAEEIYGSIGGIDKAVIRDEAAYLDGEGFQYVFSQGLLTTDQDAGIYVPAMKDDIECFMIAGKAYPYDALIRDKTQGLEVVRMLSGDFGLDIYETDGFGQMSLKSHEGSVTDTGELRNSYSAMEEFDGYTACSYYFNARMNALDDDTYEAYRKAYEDKYGADTSIYLDGLLGVVLYYDTEGHDYFYSIVISAPTYWSDEANFEANMRNNVRKEIAGCRVVTKDGLSIGMTDGLTVMCAEMPE